MVETSERPERPERPERRRKRNEKDEKQEKEEEKQEKSWEEKWRRDPASTFTWAIILIWGGIVVILETQRLMLEYPWWSAWAVFFVGAGILLALQVIIRLFMPARRRGITGIIILACIFLGIGLGGLPGIGWSWGWVLALLLIAIGLIILARGLSIRRR